MTLSNVTNKVSYAGDGATVAFAIPFPFLENGHIEAVLRDAAGAETTWTPNTEYTLSGAGVAAGGTLTVETSPDDHTPAAGETLVIRRVVPATQDTDYPEGGAFPAAAHEQALDKLTMLVQQHSEAIARALALPVSTPLTDVSLPEPGAGGVIRWNDAGTGLDTVAVGDLSLDVAAAVLDPAPGDTLVYDGTVWANRAADPVSVSDFGAAGDGTTDDTAAIQAAIDSLPAVGGGYALGDVPIRAGAVAFPAGTYLVSDTLKMTAGVTLMGTGKGQDSTTIRLADGSFTGAERFMLEVLPSQEGGIGGTPSGNITFGPEIVALYFDCNGQNNAGASGVKWYGCESNRILRCEIVNVARRGLVLSDRDDGYTAGNGTFIDRIWINGLGADAQGPGLDLRGNSITICNAAVQHFNHDGSYTDGDGDPVPAILMEGFYQSTVGTLVGEGEALFLKVKGSGILNIGAVLCGRTAGQPTTGTTGIIITGQTHYVSIDGYTVNRMAKAFVDDSASGGFTNSVDITGNVSGEVDGTYVQARRTNFVGVNDAPNGSYYFNARGGTHRFYMDNVGSIMELLLEHTGAQFPRLTFKSNGSNRAFIEVDPNNDYALRAHDALSGEFFYYRNGRFGINEVAPDYKLDVNGAIGFTPGSSVTPADNGDVVFELTNNTTLTIKAKGTDGTVRSGTVTLS